MEETQDIINAYGIEPPSSHWYWNEVSICMYNTNITDGYFHTYTEIGREKIELIQMAQQDIDT